MHVALPQYAFPHEQAGGMAADVELRRYWNCDGVFFFSLLSSKSKHYVRMMELHIQDHKGSWDKVFMVIDMSFPQAKTHQVPRKL